MRRFIRANRSSILGSSPRTCFARKRETPNSLPSLAMREGSEMNDRKPDAGDVGNSTSTAPVSSNRRDTDFHEGFPSSRIAPTGVARPGPENSPRQGVLDRRVFSGFPRTRRGSEENAATKIRERAPMLPWKLWKLEHFRF
ncbi:hypothetical protein Nwi_1281 [Nitrobacter winogradskyi Nb-255]|uniref:Uncharacterized protein n=1 Tax=Nitrobacter winogradskyi (strain ATCC 25391 / DSM 10237 / CIP 104748 / NCIMB 11846 / Nb-255) TaxID=323098 RepID=Q3ST49_NITWN|nr:hypothetical protein Nwi_1281 [Nitrobacter winogradskyi Nb-255]